MKKIILSLLLISSCSRAMEEQAIINPATLALFQAIQNQDIAALSQALDNGTDINKSVDVYRKQNVLATVDGEFLKAVCNTRNIQPHEIEGFGESPLNFAVSRFFEEHDSNNALKIIELLIAKQADVNKGELETPLNQAALMRDLPLVQLLLTAGAHANSAVTVHGFTPLSSAIHSYTLPGENKEESDQIRTEIVRLLSNHEAYISQDDIELAQKKGYGTIVEILIQKLKRRTYEKWHEIHAINVALNIKRDNTGTITNNNLQLLPEILEIIIEYAKANTEYEKEFKNIESLIALTKKVQQNF
jgi:hypothetical protein